MKTAFVTGANGFIGSHIVYRLLAQGVRVYALGRRTDAGQWPDRVLAGLREVGELAAIPGNLFCHEFDLNAPEQNLDSVSPKNHSPAEAVLFHVAGDTRFTPADPARQRQVNVEAAVKVIDAFRGQVATMIHVSTAFVAGNRTGLIRESELDCGQKFHNSYEQSKFDAEVRLTGHCRNQAVPLVIVRPGIITNDRATGRASTFTHLNALVEVISRLQKHYHLADGEVVSRRIRLLADPAARPNLAPVDSIIPPLLQIAASAASPGKVFHLCHPRPLPNLELLELICEAFQVKGKLALEFMHEVPRPMSRTEEMILRSLKPYAPYMNSRCEFDLGQSRSVVPDYDSHFSPVDVPYIRKIIEFQRRKGK